MSNKRKAYKTFTKEFKQWKDQMEKKGNVATAKKGRPKKEDQSEVTLLKQELKRVKEENEILKKAAIFFAKELD